MKRTIFFVFLAFFLCLPTGEAFVPQAPHLVYMVARKIKQPSGLRSFQTREIRVSDESGDAGAGRPTLPETLVYRFPGQLRSEIRTDTGIRVSVESGGRFIKVSDRQSVSRQKTPADHFTDVLLFRDYEGLLRQLILAGVDATKVTFQRYGDRICYVIGQPRGNKAPFPGLWIEKDSLFPVRYVMETNGWVMEFRYENWQRVSKTWYPMETSILVDGQAFTDIRVQRFELVTAFSPDLFDVDRLAAAYPGAVAHPDNGDFPEAGEKMDELEKQIEAFKNLYE